MKRLKRKGRNIDKKKHKLNVKNRNLKVNNKELTERIRCLYETVDLVKMEKKERMIKLSKRISYLSTKKKELSQNLQSTITERENKNKENIQLRKHNTILNNELHALQDEPKIIVTKDPQTRRYSDDLRTCIMDLQGTDISSNKISNVIKSVSNNILKAHANKF